MWNFNNITKTDFFFLRENDSLFELSSVEMSSSGEIGDWDFGEYLKKRERNRKLL